MYRWQTEKSVKVGNVFFLKTKEELEEEFGSLNKVPHFPYYISNKDICSKKFKISKEHKNNLYKEENPCIFLEGFNIYPEFIRFNVDSLNDIIGESCGEKDIFSDCDDVEKEMISLVDFDLVKKIFLCHRNAVEEKRVKDEFIKLYIKKWAKAKKNLYLMFGKKLTVEYEKEINSSLEVFSQNISNLCFKYPKYAAFVSLFNVQDIKENKVTRIPYRLADKGVVKIGEKITRVFSRVFEDAQFDIDISKFYTQKTKAYICFSIDIIDFLSCGMTRHGWNSCYDITSGCFCNCGIDLMMDEKTIVSFKYNRSKYDYCFDRFGKTYSFQLNSKETRTFINYDKENSVVTVANSITYVENYYYETIGSFVNDYISPNMKFFTKTYDLYEKVAVKTGFYHHIQDGIRGCFLDSTKKYKGRTLVVFGGNQLFSIVTGKPTSQKLEIG